MTRHIGAELRERPDHLVGNLPVVGDIGKHCEGIVPDEVEAGIAPNVAALNALGVHPQGLVCRQHAARNAVHVPNLGGTVIKRQGLAGGQHEIVVDRGMSIGIVVGGQGAQADQVIQMGPCAGVAYHAGIGLVLFHDHDDVPAGRRFGLRCLDCDGGCPR